MRRMKISCLILVMICTIASTAWAETPTSFVQQKVNEATTVLARPDSPSRAEELQKVADSAIDFRELASRALGSHWSARSDVEQKEFLDLLQQLLRSSYTDSISGKQLGQDYEVAYQDARIRNSRAIVRTQIKYKDDQRPIDFRLMQKGDDWVIYDIIIDDISLEETYRDGYVPIIEDEGWDSLITRMKDRITELKKAK